MTPKKLFVSELISSKRTAFVAYSPAPLVEEVLFYSQRQCSYPLAFLFAVCQYIDMFCLNCFNPSTSVSNSRASKKQAQIWRRRRCSRCGLTFTTYERPSLTDNQPVLLPDGKTEEFNSGKLIVSIAKAFTHSPEKAAYNALWLARTVEDNLSTQSQAITPEDIEAATHVTLKQFDELAAMQYAAQHHLISSFRRRGRPSWRERGRPTDG